MAKNEGKGGEESKPPVTLELPPEAQAELDRRIAEFEARHAEAIQLQIDGIAADRELLAADQARLLEDRAELEREFTALENAQQVAAQQMVAKRSGLSPERVHIKDVPADIQKDRTALKAWMADNGKKAVVKTYEVTLASGKGRRKQFDKIVAVDESEALKIAYASARIDQTQAYNPIVRRVEG